MGVLGYISGLIDLALKNKLLRMRRNLSKLARSKGWHLFSSFHLFFQVFSCSSFEDVSSRVSHFKGAVRLAYHGASPFFTSFSYRVLCITAWLLAFLTPLQTLTVGQAFAKGQQTVTLYSGISNDNDLLEIVRFQLGQFEPYSILGVGYRREFDIDNPYFTAEWGGNLVKHLEALSLFEVDALVFFRWKWFPWNQYLGTSLGIGEGFSLATGFPSSELVSQNIRSVLLNYLWVDLKFTLPSVPEWSLDLILHHRSGVYGLIGGVRGGSNYLCLGISRYW